MPFAVSGSSQSTPENDQGFRYIQNGFAKINNEFDAIEEKMNMRTGFIFVTHQYSCEDLIGAASRIESFIGKMGDDLEEWDDIGKLSQKERQLFERKAQESIDRLQSIQWLIENREPTWWENVKSVVRGIIEKLFSFFTFKLIAGKPSPKSIAA